MQQTFRLVIDCPDQVGLVAAVSHFLAGHNATIVEASHHTDLQTGRFFMRHEIRADSLPLSLEAFRAVFKPLADQYQMNWRLTDSHQKQKVALLASHESHCINDLLHRWHTNELYCDIACIIANHPHMQQFADWYDVPFHWIDFEAMGKDKAFEEIQALLGHYQADLTVLARFMQILPDSLCTELAGKAINIHHSFLPSFAGARPYQQAYDRGVKLIGATCHYVTKDLDEGPIIEQEVIRISHSDSAADMVRKGKNCEKQALANGVRYHLEDRVIIHQHKTVVFA
ncbi:formyltetrahydrofolate deformylase [Aliiglaciecola sp. CAU 1673]|uniref:formyltetrahydrofolate deformylase n=1 Tax=Aliiglaciecola sp. CAU 1673 TaxID=3032595 RepID=UPI0023DB5CA2|nr:formyltetrahydrofolate deformylase [Aliiglaciecola sp. CAU 1673]MDF2178543.1 formyltetrahydrofolate deformylase [Aliiglaciecola sp. CAU 1673]